MFLGQTINSNRVSFHLGLHLCDSKLAGKHQNKFGGGSCGVMLCGVV